MKKYKVLESFVFGNKAVKKGDVLEVDEMNASGLVSRSLISETGAKNAEEEKTEDSKGGAVSALFKSKNSK